LNVVRFCVLSSSIYPKIIKSLEIWFFFIFLANFTRVFSSSSIGEQMKTMIRWRWDLFWRCLRASFSHNDGISGCLDDMPAYILLPARENQSKWRKFLAHPRNLYTRSQVCVSPYLRPMQS